jgi:hypothetical protein
MQEVNELHFGFFFVDAIGFMAVRGVLCWYWGNLAGRGDVDKPHAIGGVL